MRKVAIGCITTFKYLLSIFMMLAGVLTAFAPLQPTRALGFIYSTRIGLLVFGIWFFVSGLTLFWGKFTNNRKMTGWGLGTIFLCFLFAGLLNGFASGWILGTYLGNFIMAAIVGLLYLRWKLKFFYI